MKLIIELNNINETAIKQGIDYILDEIEIELPKAKAIYTSDGDTHHVRIGMEGYQDIIFQEVISIDEQIIDKATVIEKIKEAFPPTIKAGPRQYKPYRNHLL